MSFNLLRLILLISLITNLSFTQEESTPNLEEVNYTYNQNKGKMYFYWGWNGASYSKSDIHFKGDNYDFTLYDVSAAHRPTELSSKNYLNPGRMTIPQTNNRIGYYFHDHYQISGGVDHMKYLVDTPQIVKIDGHINLDINEGNTAYNGIYQNDDLTLIEQDFVFEHTDGLNYVNFEIARVDDLGEYINLNPNKVQINTIAAFGLGIMYPKTNATLFGKPRYDDFHVSGFGTSIKGGLNFTFFNHFMIQGELKGGYINMPWVQTTNDGGTAYQNFWFFQRNITFGYIFQLFNGKKKN